MLGALLAMLAGGRVNPIDTIAELADATNVRPMVLNGSIVAANIQQFQNPYVRKITSKLKLLDEVGYDVGFTKLANLERYAWIETQMFMSCGSAEHGEAVFFLPKANPYNTFYTDYVALPFPKNSTLVGPLNKA